MIKILFTGVGRRIELLQAFRTAALVLGKDLRIYGADLMGSAPALAFCDFERKVVSMNDPDYINNLLKICVNDEIDLVIPTIDTDLMVLSHNIEKFEAVGTKVMISDPEKIAICRDKNKISQFFIDCGLKAPIPVNDCKKYSQVFPAFIKPKDGSSSIDAHKIENAEELEMYAKEVPDYIIQPYISGHEYTVDIFCDWDGKPISIVPRERLQVRAGEVNKTKIVMDKTMIEESKKICAAFKPCGPLTVQLIRDDTGTDWFIEINPRYGGGAPLSMKAGARSPETVLKLLDHEEVDSKQIIADGAIYSRFDQSVCIQEGYNAIFISNNDGYGNQRKKNIKGIIFDLDDTLYGEKEYIRSGFHVVSEYLGGGFEERLWKLLEDKKLAIDELLKENGREEERDTVLKLYREHKPDIHLYPGVADMISQLMETGIKVGIITDGRPEGQRRKLEALGLEDVDVIITDELGGIQFRKPCDIAFRLLATKWKLNISDIVYVGDNQAKDFQAPQQLGMRSIWFNNKDGLYSEFSSINNKKFMCVTNIVDVIGEIFDDRTK